MKKRFLLAGLAAALLSGPVLAVPPSPSPVRAVAQTQSSTAREEKFVTDLLQAAAANDVATVTNLVHQNKQMAENIFQLFFQGYGGLTDQQKRVAQAYMNVVALVYSSDGQPELTEILRSNNLLIQGDATTPPPAPPTPPTPPPANAENDYDKSFVKQYYRMVDVTLSYGNYAAARRMMASLDAAFASVANQISPEQREQLRVIMDVCDLVHLTYGGSPSSAISKARALTPLVEKYHIPVLDVNVHGLALCAARIACRPDVIDAELPIVLRLASEYKDREGPVFRFVAKTYAFERELQKDPSLDNQVVVARFQDAWKELDDYRVLGSSSGTTGEGRLYWDAYNIWLSVMFDRLLEAQAHGKEAPELSPMLQGVQRAIQYSKDAYTYEAVDCNPEFVLGFVDAGVRSIRAVLRTGDAVKARQQYTELGGHMKTLESLGRSSDKTLQEKFQKVGVMLDRYQKEHPNEKGKIDTRFMRCSFLEGSFSRAQQLYHQLGLSIMRAEKQAGRPFDVGAYERLLSQAEQDQALASKGLGYQGMEDVRWDRLDYYFTLKPAGWQQKAAPLVKEMLALNTRLDYAPGKIRALTYQGELSSSQGDKAGALGSLRQAVDLTETYVAQVGGGDQAANQARSNYQRAYQLLTKLQLDSGDAQQAYATLGRFQQVSSVAQASDALRRTSQLTGTLMTLRNANDSLQQELAVRKSENLDTKPVEQLLAQNKAEFHAALDQIRARNPRYESVLAIRPVNFSKQQRFIPANAAVVQYFPSDNDLYIFVATSTDLKIHKVQVSSATLQGLVQATRRATVTSFLQAAANGAPAISWKDDGSPTFNTVVKPLEENLFKLHSLLIAPIEAELAGKDVVAIIPTVYLNYLPFAELARPSADKGAEFLIERKQVVTLVKSSDLDQLSRPAFAGKGGVLAFGNPDGTLPAAEKEVAAIAGDFPGSQTFVGSEADKAKLKAPSPGIAYVHLATHGSLDSRDPSSSFLVMAGQGEQAKLRLPQIYELKMDTVRLVTLSACQTALGERDPGSELTSLADAFSVAGTNSVLASLWSVSDDSTRQLMSSFYGGLKEGKSLSGSLQQAELALLHNPTTAHPFYWAPFSLMGDWR